MTRAHAPRQEYEAMLNAAMGEDNPWIDYEDYAEVLAKQND